MNDVGRRPIYPWTARSPIRGNLAIGHLRESLKLWLTTERGVHAETLLCAAGAVAGFAALNALLAATGLRPADVPAFTQGQEPPNNAFVALQLASGERIFFGDRLNSYLIGGQGYDAPFFLWGFVAGALVTAGIDERFLPETGPMFANVSKTLGTRAMGMPSVPDGHRPGLSAIDFIRAAWPKVAALMRRPPPSPSVIEPDLLQEHWPIVASIVAQQLMVATKDHVKPGLAATLVMEAAIAASKLDPRTVPTEASVPA